MIISEQEDMSAQISTITSDVTSAESIYPMKLNVIYTGGNISSTHGVQFH